MKKKKYNKKYYTGGRVDMSKGGRVKAQRGGLKKAPMSSRRPPMSIEREEEVKPTVKPTVTPKKAEVVTEPKPVQPQAQKQGFAKAPTIPAEKPISIGSVGGGKPIPDETPIQPPEDTRVGQTTQETTPVEPTPEPASPEIMRETTPPDTTFTTTDEQGQVINLPNMVDWEEQYRKDKPQPPIKRGSRGKDAYDNWQKEFDIAKQQHQADLDNATVTFPTTTTAQQKSAFEEARRERIRETGLQIEAASTGEVPEGAIIPEAVRVGIDPETGKPIPEQETTVMQEVEGYVDPTAKAKTAEAVAPEAVTTGQVTTAQTPEQIQAAQMEAAMVSPDAQVEAAAGEVSDQAIAQAAGCLLYTSDAADD